MSVPDAPMYPLNKQNETCTSVNLTWPPFWFNKYGFLTITNYEIFMKKSSEPDFSVVFNKTLTLEER